MRKNLPRTSYKGKARLASLPRELNFWINYDTTQVMERAFF